MIRPACTASTSATPDTATEPRHRRHRHTSRVVTLGAAAASLVALAGCTTMSPAQTQVPYQPADGVALNVGPVQARDLLLVASAKGATGVLSGSLVNTGGTEVTVTFSAAPAADATAGAATPTPVRLAPREQKQITSVQIPSVAAAPGALTPIVMGTSEGDGITSVPVLLPTGYYSTLTPSPTSTPSDTTSAAPTGPAATTAPAAPAPAATTTAG